MTATPTSRAPTCCSGWRRSTVWPCWPPTCAPTSTRRSSAASTRSSTSPRRQPELRRALWERCLASPLPLADDLDLTFLAESFELAGGNIRSAATTAAYLAAALGAPVGMQQVVDAVEQEYRKLGRLVLEREFGRYYAELTR